MATAPGGLRRGQRLRTPRRGAAARDLIFASRRPRAFGRVSTERARRGSPTGSSDRTLSWAAVCPKVAYYDGRDFDARCKDLGVSDEKASDGDDDGDSSVAQGPEGRYTYQTVARAPGGAKDRR